jgi:hypothetical protein
MSLGLIRFTTFGGPVTEQSLGAGIEQLDDAFLVRGDDREMDAGEDRVAQGVRFQERFLPPLLEAAVRAAVLVGEDGTVSWCEHGRFP